MPFTPFHFGPSASIALPLRRYIDIPIFILANVVVDIEPLTVMVFNLRYPLHGYIHTFIFGSLAGILFAFFSYIFRRPIERFMQRVLYMEYKFHLPRAILSGALGICFHILLDSPLYFDIKPFYPLKANPFLDMFSSLEVYLACGFVFVPAVWMYWRLRGRGKERYIQM